LNLLFLIFVPQFAACQHDHRSSILFEESFFLDVPWIGHKKACVFAVQACQGRWEIESIELKSRSAAGRRTGGRHETDMLARRHWHGARTDGSGWMVRRAGGGPGRRAGRLSWRPRARVFCPVSPCARPSAHHLVARPRTRQVGSTIPPADAALPARTSFLRHQSPETMLVC